MSMKLPYKKYLALLLPAVVAVVLYSCSKVEDYNDIVSGDTTKPDVVKNIQVTSGPGSAVITYDLPQSDNILYVQATYKINDRITRQSKSSYYSDTIHVNGFAKSQEYTVTLHTVSRANVMSDPVDVKVTPQTPPYLEARPTIFTKADFGGINIALQNPSASDIGVIAIAKNSVTKQFEIVNQNYTSMEQISYSLRGYDTVDTEFGFYITDRWQNISDTFFTTVKPIYETLMDKSRFSRYILGTDVPTGFGWEIENIWNGNTGSPGYHTTQPISPLVWPAVITFDMGRAAKLSRYTIWNRGIDGSGNWLWQAGAPQSWTIWGRESNPVDETLPHGPGSPGVGQTSSNGWINLGTWTLPAKPSGLPNPQYTNTDLDFWNAGFSFNFDLELPKVRYIRFQCLENASLTNNFFNIAELSFWGDPR